MKRNKFTGITAVMMAFAMTFSCFALSACGNGSDKENNNGQNNEQNNEQNNNNNNNNGNNGNNGNNNNNNGNPSVENPPEEETPPEETPDEESPAEPHDAHTWVVVSEKAATCGEAGRIYYGCECGATKTERTAAATGDHYFVNGKCTSCGYVKEDGLSVAEAVQTFGFYFEDADESNTYTTGDAVYFGSYPQKLVVDEETLALLDGETGELPTQTSAGSWTSYGYYDEGEVADYMFYRDVEVGGTKYRGVYLLAYRSRYARLAADAEYTAIDDEGFETETVYWFEYSPIRWDVLDYIDGELVLFSYAALEAQPYQDLYDYISRKDPVYYPGSDDVYINNWEYSSLRAFLNGNFMQWAFSDAERSLIPEVELDNKWTGYAVNSEFQLAQNNTTDRVFLLSWQDAINPDYGFPATVEKYENLSENDTEKAAEALLRRRAITDYSLIQGLHKSVTATTAAGEWPCTYLLRSAGMMNYGVCNVTKYGGLLSSWSVDVRGTASYDTFAANGDLGVVPALHLKVYESADEDDFSWEPTVFTWNYEVDGVAKTLEYGLYLPEAYTDDGTPLPLITYVPDATYADRSVLQVAAGPCPSNWITAENMQKRPTAILFLNSASDVSSQMNAIIDEVCKNYNIDLDRLYLTGQSAGGIFEWALNTLYPDKFAATVYVGCQPGAEVEDETYNAVIAAEEFVGQKFIYIGSRMDVKSSAGQDAVSEVLDAYGIAYGQLYGMDRKDKTLNDQIAEVLAQGYNHNFFGYDQLAGGNSDAEHMASFTYAYKNNAVFEWLVSQTKEN